METDKKDNDDSILISDALKTGQGEAANELTVNSAKTVQPVALMRLGVFVPKPARKKGGSLAIDATDTLSSLSIMKAEGFSDVHILGPRLDMEMDFRIWVGILQAFNAHNQKGNTVDLSFREFAKYCGFPTKRLDKPLRTKFQYSMAKLRAKTLSFTNQEQTKNYVTGLIKTAYVDMDQDLVRLEADPRIWEIYRDEYRVLLRLKALNQLAKQELAQTLYTFFESLPSKPFPVSFARLRDRVCLTSEIKGQNRAIKKGLEKLNEIGYLDYSLVVKDRENYVVVHSRTPDLKPE